MRWRYDTEEPPGVWRGVRQARQALAEKGFFYVARLAAVWAALPAWRLYDKVFPRTFTFQAARHPYFLHSYNLTASNERAVEIPIVWEAVRRCRPGGRVLEVGNVLSHYFACDHEVIDKFERGPRVRNEDAESFRGPAAYDLIVSISTLEHVGWDEEPRDPRKIVRAIANLSGQLAPGGRLLATLPLGYNPPMDALIAAGALPFDRCHFLHRDGFTTWSEAGWPAVAGAGYGQGWPGTRGLVIGVVERGAP